MKYLLVLFCCYIMKCATKCILHTKNYTKLYHTISYKNYIIPSSIYPRPHVSKQNNTTFIVTNHLFQWRFRTYLPLVFQPRRKQRKIYDFLFTWVLGWYFFVIRSKQCQNRKFFPGQCPKYPLIVSLCSDLLMFLDKWVVWRLARRFETERVCSDDNKRVCSR